MCREADEPRDVFAAQLDQFGVNLHCLLDAHLLQPRRTVNQENVKVIGLQFRRHFSAPLRTSSG